MTLTPMQEALAATNERTAAITGQDSTPGKMHHVPFERNSRAETVTFMRDLIGKHLNGIVLDSQDVDLFFAATAEVVAGLHELSHQGLSCEAQICSAHSTLAQMFAAGARFERNERRRLRPDDGA